MTGENEKAPNVKLYLSTIDFGEEKLTPLSIGPVREIQKDQITDVYNQIKKEENSLTSEIKKPEYLKNYIRFSSETLKDEAEIIRSEIANLLGVDVPEVKRIYASNEQWSKSIKGIIIKTNINSNDKENLMAANFSIISSSIQRGMYKNQYPEYRIVPNKNGEAITNPTTLKIIIKKGLNALPNPTLAISKERLEKDYYRMILFDLIMNQMSRSGSDYSYYTSIGKETIKERVPFKLEDGSEDYQIQERVVDAQKTHIIPGKGNYSFMSAVYNEDEYRLNDFFVSRNSLLTLLLTEYREYVNAIVSPIIDNLDRYKECISKIIYNNTSKENAAILEEIIFKNLDKVYQIAKENKVEKDGNKVEMASTTTQQNLAILAKEEEINRKYIMNPKEVSEKQSVKTDNRLVLKAEPISNNDKKAGYVSVALVGSIIAFVCGLGFGIAYVITHLK